MRLGKLSSLVCILAGLCGCASKALPERVTQGGTLPLCPPSPNCVSSQATDDRHHIPPFAVKGGGERAFQRLRQILAARPDTRVVEETPLLLRVEFHTRFFTDDALFVLDRSAEVIHVWSASRVGYWDLGKNRRRLEEIRRALEDG